MEKVALLFSGGIDSTTLLYDLIRKGHHVDALTFNFGEREAGNELASAEDIVAELGGSVTHHYFDFAKSLREYYGLPEPQFLRKAIVMCKAVDESDNVQPFGSAIALTLAASWAVKNGIRDVYYGVHKNDSMFHDNNAEYFEMLSQLTAKCEGPEYQIRFHTPYLNIFKSDVIALGMQLGVAYGKTWSCARGGERHCGVCDPCVDRLMSFKASGFCDSTEYEVYPSGVSSDGVLAS